uniref:Uncharacterized protein n=1 Tax=Salarias fasciatus TaxID=181472 RepID=A0A672FT23_SALFA
MCLFVSLFLPLSVRFTCFFRYKKLISAHFLNYFNTFSVSFQQLFSPQMEEVSRRRRRGTPLPLSPLVEESRSRGSVPNHLLESKIYAKLKSNSLIEAEPSEIHFSGFDGVKHEAHGPILGPLFDDYNVWRLIKSCK